MTADHMRVDVGRMFVAVPALPTSVIFEAKGRDKQTGIMDIRLLRTHELRKLATRWGEELIRSAQLRALQHRMQRPPCPACGDPVACPVACPVNDPDCDSRDCECHDACEAPK